MKITGNSLTRYSLIILLMVFLFSACGNKSEPKAVKGVLDLTKWDFSEDGIRDLNGQWEFYWNRLLDPKDFPNETKRPKPMYVRVPNAWNEYKINSASLPGHGYATYRLIIRNEKSERMALSKLHPNTAFKLWVNGEPLSHAGVVSADRGKARPGQITSIVDFDGRGEDIEIIFQVSNYSYFLGGLWDRIEIGKSEEIRKNHENKIAYNIFLFGAFLIVGLSYLGFYFIRKRDRLPLWFGLFATTLALRTLVINEIFLFNIYPKIDWELVVKCNFLSITISTIFFILFLNGIYKKYTHRIVIISFLALSSVYTLAIIIFPAELYSRALRLFGSVIVASGIYFIVIIIRAIINKTYGARIVLSGFLIFFIAGIHDILAASDIIQSGQVVPLGFFLFILILSLNQFRTFSRAFNQIEELSENLEIKVQERTQELEFEKNRLKERNEMIEAELNLARKIQEQLIPLENPTENIYAIYKPMEQVGGDFYDFLIFPDSQKIGIFLSDVSGHGVPSAFITAIIKTILLQSGERRENPAQLLSFLNDLLLDQTGGNFVTAFYCIYDPAIRKITFSNAGHNPPYLVTETAVEEISGYKSLPLATMANDYLESVNKPYRNTELTIARKSKLILYTDGLSETTPIDNRNKLFEQEIKSIFQNLYSSRSKEFVDSVLDALVQFRGDVTFEDDICLICMDTE